MCRQLDEGEGNSTTCEFCLPFPFVDRPQKVHLVGFQSYTSNTTANTQTSQLRKPTSDETKNHKSEYSIFNSSLIVLCSLRKYQWLFSLSRLTLHTSMAIKTENHHHRRVHSPHPHRHIFLVLCHSAWSESIIRSNATRSPPFIPIRKDKPKASL
jgi:hypothetical protein